jgi:hypothetical protein
MQIIGNGKAWATISRIFLACSYFSINFTLFGSHEKCKNKKKHVKNLTTPAIFKLQQRIE